MRTPGNDRELVTGLLYNEGIIEDSDEILALDIEEGVARVSLPEERLEGLMAMRGPLIVPGSCGVCGRLSLHKHKRVVSSDLVSEADLTNITKERGLNKACSMKLGVHIVPLLTIARVCYYPRWKMLVGTMLWTS